MAAAALIRRPRARQGLGEECRVAAPQLALETGNPGIGLVDARHGFLEEPYRLLRNVDRHFLPIFR